MIDMDHDSEYFREHEYSQHRDPELVQISAALIITARSIVNLVEVFHHLHQQGALIMSNLESLRGLQAAQSDAITSLGETIVAEAAQVTQILNDLVEAQSNGVTADDVAAAQQALDRLTSLGTEVAGIAPDA